MFSSDTALEGGRNLTNRCYWKTPEQEVLSADFFLVQLTWQALISFHRQSQRWISKSLLQSKSASTLLYNCGSREVKHFAQSYSTDCNHTKNEPNLPNPSQYPTLLLLQPRTLAAEDIGKLTDFVQQLAVCNFRRISRFIPFPGKAR